MGPKESLYAPTPLWDGAAYEGTIALCGISRAKKLFQKFPGFRLAISRHLKPNPLVEKWIYILNQSSDLAENKERNVCVLQQSGSHGKLDAVVCLKHDY